MDPVCVKLNLYRGDTWHTTLRLWEDEARTIPLDISGQEASSYIKDEFDGAERMILDATVTAPNLIQLLLPFGQWADWPATQLTGVWDVQLTDSSGNVTTVAYGDVAIQPDVTTMGFAEDELTPAES